MGVGLLEAHYKIFRQEESNFSDGGKASSMAKKALQNVGFKVPSFNGICSYTPIPVLRAPLHPNQCLTLTKEALHYWEFNLCCNSATHRIRLWF